MPKRMKSFLANSWVQGIACSLIGSAIWALKDYSKITWLKSLLLSEIPVWQILIAICTILLLRVVQKAFHAGKSKNVHYPFMEFTTGQYQSRQWQWVWKYDRQTGTYKVEDLNILCPNCKTGILHLVYTDYHCGQCNADSVETVADSPLCR